MPSNANNQPEFDALLSRLSQGDLDDDGKRRLAELMKDNPEAIAAYLDVIEMDAMLRETYGSLHLPHAAPPRKGPSKGFRSSYRLSTVAAVALLAAGLGLVAFQSKDVQVALGLRSDESPASPPVVGAVVAKVGRNVGARLRFEEGPSIDALAGKDVRAGRYELPDGLLELQYENGAGVVLQAPVRFELVSKKRVLLLEGRASARCPTEESKGFTLETPSGVAVDLGTEFAVEVKGEGQGEDEFHVFSGEVVISPKSDEGPGRVKLREGQATRLDHRTSTPAGIDVNHYRFVRGFERSSPAYYQSVMALAPDVYYAMRFGEGGRVLINETEADADAVIEPVDSRFECWAPGVNGGASLRLDGPRSSTYAVAEDYPKATGDCLSVVAWVYAESRPWWGSIAKNWQHGLDPEYRGQFHFGLYNLEGTLEAHVNDRDNEECFVMESIPLPLNCWHHVAMVADGQMLRLYRNGEEVDATPYNGLNGNPDIRPLAIGSKLGDDSMSPARPDSGFWDGCIDHLAIFNKALSADQIRDLYAVGAATMSAPRPAE